MINRFCTGDDKLPQKIENNQGESVLFQNNPELPLTHSQCLFETVAYPPSKQIENFNCTCLESNHSTSPPNPQMAFAKI